MCRIGIAPSFLLLSRSNVKRALEILSTGKVYGCFEKRYIFCKKKIRDPEVGLEGVPKKEAQIEGSTFCTDPKKQGRENRNKEAMK